MPRVMMTCTRSGKPIFTGLDLPLGSPLRGYAKIKVPCMHCGKSHGIRRPFFEGQGPTDFKKYFVALDCEPDFAAEVGVLISCFALIEDYVPRLVAKLIGISYEDAFVITGSFVSFAHKVDLLESLAKLRHETVEARIAIERLVPRIRNANTTRNQYAHARYGITFNDDFMVDSFINDAKRKTKNARKSLDDIVEDVNLLKRAIDHLHAYVYRDEMPPPYSGLPG
jgi:hypothetical protein